MYRMHRGCLPVEWLVVGPIENNVYIIGDTDDCFVVDPSCYPERILAALAGRTPKAIVITHRHWDHTGAAAALREATGAPVIASAVDAPLIEHPTEPRCIACPVDVKVSHGDVVEIGSRGWRVILTPGHTQGSMCLYIDPRLGSNPEGAPLLVSGDTLFCGCIGRTDFEGGSLDDMRHSLKRLAVLPDETIVLPGHNDLTYIGAERQRVFAHYALPDDEAEDVRAEG